MARKYALKAGVANGGFGWQMDECEEKLLIAAYTDCQARITTTAWKTDFETHFYNLGSGVTHHSLKMINQNLKRVGQDPVEFVETDIGEYARNPDRETKAKIRGTFRDQYLALDTVGKVRWQNAAREAVSALDPPHQTYEEMIAARRPTNPNTLSEQEMAKRANALTAKLASPAPEDRVARVMRQLKLTQNKELIAKIVATLKADEALDLAEQVECQDMRDLLVERSMEVIHADQV